MVGVWLWTCSYFLQLFLIGVDMPSQFCLHFVPVGLSGWVSPADIEPVPSFLCRVAPKRECQEHHHRSYWQVAYYCIHIICISFLPDKHHLVCYKRHKINKCFLWLHFHFWFLCFSTDWLCLLTEKMDLESLLKSSYLIFSHSKWQLSYRYTIFQCLLKTYRVV